MISSTSTKRLSGLDHCRSLAIIFVFVYHYRIFGNPPLVDTIGEFGWTGVDLFFVLSGYLIGGQLLGAIAKDRPIAYGEFWFKRFMRIIPAYAATLILYYTIPAFTERSHLPPLWKLVTFTQNFGLDLTKTAAFSHAWSLCIEEQFYLILPLVIFALVIKSNGSGLHTSHFSRHARLTIPVIVILGLAARTFCWFHFIAPIPPDGPRGIPFYKWIYYPTWGRLDGLLAGVSLAAVYHFKPQTWQKLTRHGNTWLLASLGLITAAGFLSAGFDTFRTAVLGFPLISLAYGLLVLAALSPNTFLYRFGSRLTRFIATISYSLYLTHKQIIHLTQQLLVGPDGDHDSYWLFAACAFTSLVAATLLHFAVERPFLKWRDRLTILYKSKL